MLTMRGSWIMTTVVGTGEAGYAGDGSPATTARLNEPKGVAVDAVGHVYIADSENHVIRKVDGHTGLVTTVAGMADAAPASEAEPDQLTRSRDEVDPFADATEDAMRKYTQQADLSGTVRYVMGRPVQQRFAGDGGPARLARLQFPTAVAVDGQGNLFIADTMNHRVRRVDAETGIMTTLAGTGQPRFSGDGGPAHQAALNEPAALALDGRGRLFIADQSNNRIRVVDLSTGLIATFAGTGTAAYDGDGGPAAGASLAGPSGLAVHEGLLYIADTFNGRIRAVHLESGLISTVAGDGGEYRFQSASEGPSVSLSRPSGLCLDSQGRLFVTDSDSHLVRCWDPASRSIVRVAGSGHAAYGGDGGPALEAQLSYPFGMAADRRGLLVADTFNHRLRRLSWEGNRADD
jgi:sugar lactone lactonase YvrE